jgi:hypothetical protein
MTQQPLFDLSAFNDPQSKVNPFPVGYFKNKPRPASSHPDVVLLTNMDLAQRIYDWTEREDEEEEREELLDELRTFLKEHTSSDGFQRARALDDAWIELERDVDSELVSILEDASTYNAHQHALTRWVEDNGIKPKLAVDAIVKVHDQDYRGKDKPLVSGEIRSIDEKRGIYTIAIPSKGHLPKKQGNTKETFRSGTVGWCINFEDAEAANEA